MKKMSFILILTFLLFACATPAKYDSKLNRLVGVSKSQLIKDMGQPSATKVFANGDEVLAYVKANDVYVPSEFYLYNQGALSNEYDGIYSPFLGDYDFSPYGAAFGYEVENICQTVFLIQTEWSPVGNGAAMIAWHINEKRKTLHGFPFFPNVVGK